MIYMKNTALAIIFLLVFFLWAACPVFAVSVSGKILLQTEENGEAWYVNPLTEKRYYLGRPADAFAVMRSSGIGITNSDLNKIPTAFGSLGDLESRDSDNDGYSDADELRGGYDPYGSGRIVLDVDFADKHKGKIFLQVENNGEAWYVNPEDGLRYFLGRPADAFRVMREMGLGITNSDLEDIAEGDIYNIEEEITEGSKVLNSKEVPFSPQAPFGNWADPRQEDGCEEVSALMAVRWARGQDLSRQEALDELIAISEYEKANWGNYHDTSAYDTMERIVKGYFDLHNVEYKQNVSLQDLIGALQAGNILIVPINGMIVGNPYYTQPGPPRHMLVVKDYDPDRDIFITNDPGTRRGEDFEYPADKFYDSIRDYPTGVHPPVTGNEKNIIVINK